MAPSTNNTYDRDELRKKRQPWRPRGAIHQKKGSDLLTSVQQAYFKKAKTLFEQDKPLPLTPDETYEVEVSTTSFLNDDELLVKTQMPKLYRVASEAPLTKPVRRKESVTALSMPASPVQKKPNAPPRIRRPIHQKPSNSDVQDMLRMRDQRSPSVTSSTAVVTGNSEHQSVKLSQSVEKLDAMEQLLKEACVDYEDKPAINVTQSKPGRTQSEHLSKLDLKLPSPIHNIRSPMHMKTSPLRNSFHSFFDYTSISKESVDAFKPSKPMVQLTVYVDCENEDTVLIRHELESSVLEHVKDDQCNVLVNVIEQVLKKLQQMTASVISDSFRISYKSNNGQWVILMNDADLKQAVNSSLNDKVTLRMSN